MANETSRRCPNCKVMYVNKDYCPTCGIIINTNLKRELERQKKEVKKQAERNDPKNKTAVTLFLEKINDHENLVIRYVARFFYSIWIIVLAIGSFIALLFSYIAA